MQKVHFITRLRVGLLRFCAVLCVAQCTASIASGAPAPDIVLSYILNPGGNHSSLVSGGVIQFRPTAAGQTSTATVTLANKGTATDTLKTASLSSETFRVSGLPVLPASIATGGAIQFTISFAPVSGIAVEGVLQIELDGRTVIVRLRGEGVAPAIVYQYRTDTDTISAAPGGRLQLSPAPVNSIRTTDFQIRNTGNGEARISTIAISGSAYQLIEVPALPVTLPPGASTSFRIQFSPREAGLAAGQLRIDASSFAVEGIGLGSRLTLNTSSGAVGEAGLLFPATSVGGRTTVRIEVRNTGTAPGAVHGIGVSGSGFRLEVPPAFPVTLAPEEALEFTLAFQPEALGPATGTLQVDERSFGVRAVGTQPPAVPPADLTGIADTVEPMQQPAVGIQLAEPYAFDLTGRLTLTLQSLDLADDPAVRFATGGRTIEFRIPTGSRDAIFSQGGKVPFQSGTVAGSLVFSISLQVATVNVTPTPFSRTVSVPVGPPRIQSVRIGTRNERGFELLVTGFDPVRSLSEMAFSFAAAAGVALQNATLRVPVADAFDAWYQNASSRAFGSQFTASVFLNVTGNAGNIDSVSVTAVGRGGTSEPKTVSLR